jgi:Phage phiEco32-like COOH.NH2 ligase-type 2
MTKFTIGCDPEIFLTEEDGTPVSAHDLLPGTKKEPHKVPYGAIQVDGTAAEFNTDPVPSTDFDAFNRNVVKVMGDLHKEVSRNAKRPIKMKLASVQDYPEGYFAELPETAKELGCDPDYSAYTLQPNPRPDNTKTFRTGSGHLHIGWAADIPVDNPEHIEICADFVKMLDVTVGLFMTYLDRDPRRRELYGKAGAFRPKPYGVEYRTPSNVWIQQKCYRKMICDGLHKAIIYKSSGYTVERVTGVTEEAIQMIIDTGNVSSAHTLLSRIYNGSYTFSRCVEEINAQMKKAA